MLAEYPAPFLRWTGKIAAVPARQQTSNGSLFGHYQLQGVNVTVLAEKRSQMRENSQHMLRAQVVEETVRQYEIELLPRSYAIVADIRNDEISLMPSARTFDIALVEIDTEILDLSKVPRVCAWATSDIKHTMHTAQVVVRENWDELLFRKRGLPQPVHDTMIEYPLH